MQKIAVLTLVLAVSTGPAVSAGYGFLNVGIDYYNQERYADAITWLDKAITAGDLVPDQLAAAYLDRGIALVRTGMAEKAIKDFNAALDLRNEDHMILSGRALAYVTANQPDLAMADINTLRQKLPDNINLAFECGLLEWQLGRYEDAGKAFDKAATTGQPYAWLWGQLVNIKQGKSVVPYSVAAPDAGRKYRRGAPTEWPAPIMALYGGDGGEDRIRAEMAKESAGGVAGSLMTTYVSADSFAIGKMTGSGVPIYIDPRIDAVGVDGTLAPDMMSKFDVDIDFAHGTLNLFSPDHCPGKVVYWTQGDAVVIPMNLAPGGHIRVPVTLNGKPMTALLDTGARTSLISLAAAKQLGIAESDPKLKMKASFGSNGKYREYSYPFESLLLDGITVKSPHISVMSDDMVKGVREPMILGVGIMRQLHIYIAYGEQKIYLTPAMAN